MLIFETIYVKDFSPSRQHVVADDHVQHTTQASEGAYILDKDKIRSSSPLTTGSSADVAMVPPSPSLLTEDAMNDGCILTTLVRICNLWLCTVIPLSLVGIFGRNT
jgi:hypothetical protein